MVESNSVTIAGPARRWPGCSVGAVVDRRRRRSPWKRISPRSAGCGSPSPPARPRGSSGDGRAPVADRAQVDDLRRRVRHAEAVELLVQVVEAPVEHADVALQRHGDLVALAVVAHVGHEGDRLRVGRDRPRRPSSSRARPSRSSRIAVTSSALASRGEPDERPRELVAEVGHEVAERAQQARRGRHDDGEGAHQLGDRVGVQRPGAAEGDERELARVVAALDGDHAQRAGHVLVDDRQDALRRLRRRDRPDRVGDRGDGGAARPRRRAPSRRRSGAAAGGRRRRWRPSPSAPRRRGRRRPGRARRPPTRGPTRSALGELGHVRDRAAARADGVHVDATGP